MSARNYHVGVWFSEKNEPDILWTDLSEKELQSRFLTKYRRGARIVDRGSHFDFSKVLRVAISATDEPAWDALKKVDAQRNRETEEFNRSGSSFVFIGFADSPLQDILLVGDDVTSRFITEAPASDNVLLSFIHNNWTVTIVSGLVLLAIAGFFGIG